MKNENEVIEVVEETQDEKTVVEKTRAQKFWGKMKNIGTKVLFYTKKAAKVAGVVIGAVVIAGVIYLIKQNKNGEIEYEARPDLTEDDVSDIVQDDSSESEITDETSTEVNSEE